MRIACCFFGSRLVKGVYCLTKLWFWENRWPVLEPSQCIKISRINGCQAQEYNMLDEAPLLCFLIRPLASAAAVCRLRFQFQHRVP
jgi:hypothetical protein